MEITPRQRTLFSINHFKKKINTQPIYQRGNVWSEEKRQYLIDTILRGYDVPKLYLRCISSKEFLYEVVDGQQRLNAIWGFFNNEFPLGEASIDLPEFGDLSGKYYNQLDAEQLEFFGSFELTITEVRNASDLETSDLFLRLQEGKTLNPAEKRNAIMGNMRDFIAELSNHKVFEHVRVPDKRFQYADFCAHITALEIAKGPTDIQATNLKKMYEKEKKFDPTGLVAKKIKKVFNYMDKVLSTSPPEMDIKWGFVDLYLLISELIEKYDISDYSEKVCEFYINFEKKRRAVKDTIELITPGSTNFDKELYKYIEAFVREGNKKHNLEIRNEVYLNTFLSENPDLKAKDPKRDFNKNERIVIWRRAEGKCENSECGIEVKLEDMHADHKIPHSRGGQTTVSNGQCLCTKCNLTKSASI